MRRKQIMAAIFFTLLLGTAGAAWYIFFKPHRNLQDGSITRVGADSLFMAFQQDESKANAAYLDKALEVTGTIAGMETNQQGQTVLLLDGGDPMGGVACTLSEPAAGIAKGDQVVVRGFCSGFLTDVVLRDGVLVHH
jgi:tRNA_anti-like